MRCRDCSFLPGRRRTEMGAVAYRAGLEALRAGTPAEALAPLTATLDDPVHGEWARLNLGLALQALGRLAEAEGHLAMAMAALPDLAEPPFRLGTIAGLRGDPASAMALFRAALARDPAHIPAHAALAALTEEAGDRAAARALLETAHRLDASEPELILALARLALTEGNADAAREGAAQVLAMRPAHAAAARLFAEASLALGGMTAALAEVSACAEADPFAAGWALAGAWLREAAEGPAAALADLRTAQLLAPEVPEILAALGHALAGAERTAEAEATLRAAIAARPGDLDLRNRLATVLWKANRLSAMLDLLEAAIRDFGPHPTLLQNRALALNAIGEQEAALATAEAALAGGGVPALVNRIAVLPYHPEAGTAAGLRTAAEAIGQAMPLQAPLVVRRRLGEGRLRVGLLSGGLGQHPVGWLTLAGLEALPEVEFELFAYALKPRADPLAARFRARCARWREVGAMEDAAIAGLIAEDGIDILIEMGGYGEGGRPFVLQYRPAPVQLKWVGAQFSTLGLAGCDGILTDRWETPLGAEPHYTERLLRLPDGYVCYLPPPYAPPVTPLPALAADGVTFGCFNNLAKVTAPVLAAWARILAALPTARLMLRTHALGEATTRARVGERLARAGLPLGRVALEGGLPHRELLAAYGDIDIALDPFPYAGGLTVCEALWMGVPVLALAGDSFCGRHALSHLSNVGLADWVAGTADEYVTQAIARACDLDGLAALRQGLRGRVAASPLVDAPRFARALGGVLRQAWATAAR
ncbi:Glycosyl transferase family 41 [Belnapia rosea]|uniref:protein O-GlcNAc transferase n=2 Tax=Belnapia rosea TaxID=938405 RepID=A0A1G6KHI1_9PROT|nr:Glycosyl transferase family 41 [Belnapia rosea]